VNGDITILSKRFGQLMLAHQLTVTCAESCTGGGIASAITDTPGSSQWFHAGFVTYSNDAKERYLDVFPETLSTQGAVSEAVVEQMAKGALKNTSADLAVAVSGIAGPDGGTADKPVGTVWFCWCTRGKQVNRSRTITRCVQLKGNRLAIRKAAVEVALKGLIEQVENYITV